MIFQEGDIAFDRFLLQKKLSFGSFSIVYLAKDQQTQEDVALKIESLAENPCPMIKHEYNVFKRLNPSPNVCRAIGLYESPTHYGLSMEILFDNLANIRRKRMKKPSLSLLMKVTIQCLECFNVLHHQEIIHSDVKPSNFAIRTLSNDFQVVIFDFGLSSYDGEDSSITHFRNNLGRNPRYLALHTHKTGIWTKEDDIESLIYSISDFWNNELPWDGRTKDPLVIEMKDGYDLKKLLPEELHQLIIHKNDDVDSIIKILKPIYNKMPKNHDEDNHYIFDPRDPDYKPKLVDYVLDKDAKLKFTNQHSA